MKQSPSPGRFLLDTGLRVSYMSQSVLHLKRMISFIDFQVPMPTVACLLILLTIFSSFHGIAEGQDNELSLLADHETIDIARASLLLSKDFDDKLDIEWNLRLVDALSESLKLKVPDDLPLPDRTKRISEALFDEYSVDLSTNRFDPEHGFLAHVLKNKSGNCLGLSTLLLAVGQRLDLPLFLVQVPTHVFVRHDDGETIFNIETTGNGSIFKEEYYRKRYRVTKSRPFLHNLEPKAVLAELLRNRGLAWKMRGNWARAISDYDRAVILDPESASAFLNRAYALSMTEDFERAMKDYDRTIELDPECALSFLGRGYLWRRLEEHEKAIDDYTRSIEINTRDGQAHANRGYEWFLLKEYDKSIADCTAALAINPKNAHALNNRGHGWFVKENYAQAVADHIRAMELDASYISNFEETIDDNAVRAYRLYTPDRFEDAVEGFSDRIETEGERADLYYYRGFVFCELGRYIKAVDDLSKSIMLDPFNRWAFIKRAEAFERLGKNRAARRDLERAEALGEPIDPFGDGETR